MQSPRVPAEGAPVLPAGHIDACRALLLNLNLDIAIKHRHRDYLAAAIVTVTRSIG
jgi:hypothetical protein